MEKKISSAWGLRKPHAVRQAQESVLSLDQELCPRLWCRTWRRWYFRHVILALIIVMDGRDLKAHQPCHYSHFALQKILSKTADQQNHSASAGLDFDMYHVLEHFGQGTMKAYTCTFFFWLDVHKVKWFLVSSLDWLPDGQVWKWSPDPPSSPLLHKGMFWNNGRFQLGNTWGKLCKQCKLCLLLSKSFVQLVTEMQG